MYFNKLFNTKLVRLSNKSYMQIIGLIQSARNMNAPNMVKTRSNVRYRSTIMTYIHVIVAGISIRYLILLLVGSIRYRINHNYVNMKPTVNDLWFGLSSVKTCFSRLSVSLILEFESEVVY